MDLASGARVRVQFADGTAATGVVEEPAVYPNHWFKLRMDDGSIVKQRAASIELLSTAAPPSPSAAPAPDAVVDQLQLQPPTAEISAPEAPTEANEMEMEAPPVASTVVGAASTLLLSDIDESQWQGRQVRIDSGKMAGKTGIVASHKTGWIRVSVEGESEMVKKRANELAVLPGSSSETFLPSISTSTSNKSTPSRTSSTKKPQLEQAEGEEENVDDDEDSDNGTPTAERALIGEAVKIMSGEHSGRIGFVTQRTADGLFCVSIGDAEVHCRRDQFRKTSSAAALAAALAVIEPNTTSDNEMATSRMPRRTRAAVSTATTPSTTPTAAKEPAKKRRARPAAERPKAQKRPRISDVSDGEEGAATSDSEAKGQTTAAAVATIGQQDRAAPSKRAPRMNADKLLAQEMKGMISGSLPSALDSLGLSEADKEALVEGLTPRRSSRGAKQPVGKSSPAGRSRTLRAPTDQEDSVDESDSEVEPPAPRPKKRDRPVVDQEVPAEGPFPAEVEDTTIEANESEGTVLPARQSLEEGVSLSLRKKLKPGRQKARPAEPMSAAPPQAAVPQPGSNGGEMGPPVHSTLHAGAKRSREPVQDSERPADDALLGERLEAEDMNGRSKRPKKMKDKTKNQSVKFGAPANEPAVSEVPRRVESSGDVPHKRKKGQLGDKPLKGVGWEYVPVTDGPTLTGGNYSASANTFYSLPLQERVRAYVQRIQEKHAREKRTDIRVFFDRLDTPVVGDPFFARHREWTRPEPGEVLPSPMSTDSGFAGPRASPTEQISGIKASKQSIADSIIGAGKEAKEAKEADTAGKVVRFFKVGSGRLEKAAALAMGEPVADSSSDESSDEEYVYHNLEGAAHSQMRQVQREASQQHKRYVPPPDASISDNFPYMYSWNYKHDVAVDKVAAVGSHHRPPFYGARGLTSFVTAHEEALVYSTSESAQAPTLNDQVLTAIDTVAKTNDLFAYAKLRPLAENADPSIATRAEMLAKPMSDASSLYAYERCVYCGVPKEDRGSICCNIACVCCPLNARFKPTTRSNENPEGRPVYPAEGLYDPLRMEAVKVTFASQQHERQHYAEVGISLVHPQESTAAVLEQVEAAHNVNVPKAEWYKQPESAATIKQPLKEIFSDAQEQGTARMEHIMQRHRSCRAAVDVYYDLLFDTTARRVLSGRPLHTRILTDRKRLPSASVWGYDVEEIEHHATEETGAQSNEHVVRKEPGVDERKMESVSSVSQLIPSVGRPWQRGWLKKAIANLDMEEQDDVDKKTVSSKKGSTHAERMKLLKKQKRPKKGKKREGPKQRIVFQDGWTYTIDDDDDHGAADETIDAPADAPALSDDVDFSKYVAPILHRDPDYESTAYREHERERSFDPYYADSDPFVSGYARRPPDIYPFDPLHHDHIYGMPDPRSQRSDGPENEDLLPDCEAATALKDDACFRLAAAADAMVISDYQFDAPVYYLGANIHPRMLRCGDPGNELALRYSLGQADDEYYYTKACQLPAPGHQLKDHPGKLGYPSTETTGPGLGGNPPFALDPLLYQVSSWHRGDEQEHPDLQASAVLMDVAMSQLPAEEHRALSRETHELVAGVVHRQQAAQTEQPNGEIEAATPNESAEAMATAVYDPVKDDEEQADVQETTSTHLAEDEGAAADRSAGAQAMAALAEAVSERVSSPDANVVTSEQPMAEIAQSVVESPQSAAQSSPTDLDACDAAATMGTFRAIADQ